MRMLNEGLSKADALVIVPVYQVCWVTMNTIVGMIYFEDYKEMIPWHTALFLIGVAITLVGVFLLSKRDSATKVKLTGPIQIQDAGGYIEEVVSSLDELGLPGEGLPSPSLDQLPPNKSKDYEDEEPEVRNPFLDTAPSSLSDLISTINLSQGGSTSIIAESVDPATGGQNTEKPSVIGDEDGVGNIDTTPGLETDDGDSVHPQAPLAGSNPHSFSLSWSWWARSGTRKLYTPLF